MISSEGDAMKERSELMGRYTLSKNVLMNYYPLLVNVPVYKKDDGEFYLHLNCRGFWSVSSIPGYSDGCMRQFNLGDPGSSPLKNLPWQYCANGCLKDDDTLKVYPCYY